MARPITSARSTMPAPPPAGVSSTLRCRPSPNSRRSMVSSDHSPSRSARPVRLSARTPGKACGSRVMTRAVHTCASTGVCVIRSRGCIEGRMLLRPWERGVSAMVSEYPFGRVGDDAARAKVDGRHRLAGEGQKHGAALARHLDLEQVRGPVIEHRAHAAQRGPAGIVNGKPNEISVIEFVFRQVWQAFARHEKPCAAQGLGLFPGRDAGNARGERARGLPDKRDMKAAGAVLGAERTVGGDVLGAGGEALEPHLAVDAEAPGNGADADRVAHGWTLS